MLNKSASVRLHYKAAPSWNYVLFLKLLECQSKCKPLLRGDRLQKAADTNCTHYDTSVVPLQNTDNYIFIFRTLALSIRISLQYPNRGTLLGFHAEQNYLTVAAYVAGFGSRFPVSKMYTTWPKVCGQSKYCECDGWTSDSDATHFPVSAFWPGVGTWLH